MKQKMAKIKVKKIIKNNWHWPVVLAMAIVFFLSVSSFNFLTQEYSKSGDFVKWASPDETANYIFTKLYAQTGELKFDEKYNIITKDIMRPRSFRSDNGELKPVSFLGIIIIYGQIAKLFSYKIIPYLTPLFGALGIIFFYLFIKRIFGKKNALISAFLLAIFPPFIYYSARSMFHNVLFVVLLLAGLYFLVLAYKSRKKIIMIKEKNWSKIDIKGFIAISLSGLLFGLAIMTRTAELLWVLPTISIVWLFNIKRAGIYKPLIFIVFVGLGLVPGFYYNQVLYGSFYFGGYAEMNTSLLTLKEAGSGLVTSAVIGEFDKVYRLLATIKNTIFYFGFNLPQSLNMLAAYFAKMFYWMFWLSLLGFLLFLSQWRKIKRRHWSFIAGAAVFSVILVLYYGSWVFHDNPDPNSATIGNSYTRYWLPIYMASFPFVSFYLIKITKAIAVLFPNKIESKTKFFSKYIRRKYIVAGVKLSVLGIIAFWSIQFVLIGSEEGLVYLAGRQHSAKYEFNRVLELTESNSTIITRYHDKLFFPERKVIVGLFDDKEMVAQYANLVKYLPLYYYNFTLPKRDFDYLNDRRLLEAGLGIEAVSKVTDKFTLYKLFKQEAVEVKLEQE